MCLDYSVEISVLRLLQITVSKIQVMFIKSHVYDIKENGDSIQEYNPLYIHVNMHRNKFLFNNQPDTLIIQIYSVMKLYTFWASSLHIIRSFLLYIRHW